MGKKTGQSPSTKAPTKHEKKHQIHSLIKILRPKVYITDSSNFKNLVQELTGNGSSPMSSPPPCFNSVASPPIGPPFFDRYAYQENSLDMSSFDSSCFSTPLEGSPDLRPIDSFNYATDFSSQIMDLESLLMGIDSISNTYDSCHATTHQQEVCLFDYDFSSFDMNMI